ncbi:MAG: hypothetical protein IKI19_07220 [Prevotella sp.]|nr:hypothetical protein [Prevotella sp.]MBR6998576.1 hypothetical protein [Prevotella sp.]
MIFLPIPPEIGFLLLFLLVAVPLAYAAIWAAALVVAPFMLLFQKLRPSAKPGPATKLQPVAEEQKTFMPELSAAPRTELHIDEYFSPNNKVEWHYCQPYVYQVCIRNTALDKEKTIQGRNIDDVEGDIRKWFLRWCIEEKSTA